MVRSPDAEGSGGADIVKIARAQELRADDADKADPAERQQQDQDGEEARDDDAGHNDEDIERRQAGPNLDKALEQQIKPAAIEALQRSRLRRR